jgi:hypothetical protein
MFNSMSSKNRVALSCGRTLLLNHQSTSYSLHIQEIGTDNFVILKCHRDVLISHSVVLSNLILNGSNYFSCRVDVRQGFIPSMLEIIQFMYLKDVNLFTDIMKVKQLSEWLQMSDVFYECSNLLSAKENTKETDMKKWCTKIDVHDDSGDDSDGMDAEFEDEKSSSSTCATEISNKSRGKNGNIITEPRQTTSGPNQNTNGLKNTIMGLRRYNLRSGRRRLRARKRVSYVS